VCGGWEVGDRAEGGKIRRFDEIRNMRPRGQGGAEADQKKRQRKKLKRKNSRIKVLRKAPVIGEGGGITFSEGRRGKSKARVLPQWKENGF